ncbi:hypothetical protein J6590_088410 [Homalodisca vitripennis]|nr:hypothetical protein J6590_088410 [Homalodisca vitripennis]
MFENDSHGGSPPADTIDTTTYWCQRGQANVLMVITRFMGCTCEAAGAEEHLRAIKYPAGAVSRLGHCYWNVSDTS